jgi:hypothetical protein
VKFFCGDGARDKPNGSPLAKPSAIQNTDDRLPSYIASEKSVDMD